MENTKIFENIGEFSLFLKKSNNLELNTLNYFNQIRAAHENTFSGCSCNRQKRIAQAAEVYKKFIVESSDQFMQELKKYLQVEKIIFKHENKEFAKF